MAAGATVLEAAQAAGVELVAVCGGVGTCDTCRVRLAEGTLSPLTTTEQEELREGEQAAGVRLACQATLLSDARLIIPPESLATPQRLQLEGRRIAIEPDPPVVSVDVALDPPALHDLRADGTRLADALTTQGRPVPAISRPVLAEASTRLRAQGWQARLALYRSEAGEELIAVLPPDGRLLGVAFDLGTTKLAGYLVDLNSGAVLAQAGAMNPQIAYGEDVVSRIAYANRHEDHPRVLQAALAGAVDTLVGDLCAEAGADRDRVVEAVAVGNTAMHHLFAGLPVRPLGEAPYVPATTDPLSFRAVEAGLRLAPGARVFMPPNVAGYVGSDHVAMLLAADVRPTRQTVTLALDIGTNTEISLAAGERLLTCSCASGPAFEGAHIHDGMRAVPGAIERVQTADATFHLHTIGDVPPVGLCGSGILDAVAALHEAGLLSRGGTLRDGDPRVRKRDGRVECVLAPAASTGHGRDIVVTRRDVHEIQLAKAAIRAGIEIVLAEAGLTASAVDAFVVAGAFGTYLSLENAITIGLFPDLPLERVRQVGNAAGMGAIQLLLSARHRRTAAERAQRLDYVELTNHPRFTDVFMDALLF